MNLALFFALLCIALCNVKAEYWAYHTVLDGPGKFHLYWQSPEDKKADSEIIFKVEVETKGYVGFGLSPNGGMAGSDIVTGWIKNGQPYFQDRHGVGNSMPIVDDSQDWKLIASYENDTFTVFTFSRKLDTCDEQDMVIDESTMRVIYAYNNKVPTSENPTYHHNNRGSKSIMLLHSKVKKNLDLDLSTFLQWNIESPDIDISLDKTLYWCKIFKTPNVSKKHHMVYVKPQIQEGHEQFVHHMVLYECVGGTPKEYEQYLDYRGHKCYHPNMPAALQKCEGVSIAWAVGGEDVEFPEHVGMPLDPDPGTYFLLEIHYDNPHLEKGIIDHSGLTIYYTPNLRKYDSGCLMVGSTMLTSRLFIPPGQDKYVVVGHSNPDCFAPGFPKSGVKALGVALHSHLLGRRIKARHFRGNQELALLADDKNYDFNYQEYRYYPNEVEILPNDQITVECTYESSERDNVTFGGQSTEEEMCLAFILYYPRVKRYASLSVPTIDSINKALKTNFSSARDVNYGLLAYNWTSTDMGEVENMMRNSEHTTYCLLGDGDRNSVSSLIGYPTDLKALVEDSSCSGSQSLMQEQDLSEDSSCSGSLSLMHEQDLSISLAICIIILILNL